MSDFYKLFQFGHEFEKTHESRVQIIRHGRVDSGVKIASEATDYIANVEPELGKTFVLVLAISASNTMARIVMGMPLVNDRSTIVQSLGNACGTYEVI